MKTYYLFPSLITLAILLGGCTNTPSIADNIDLPAATPVATIQPTPTPSPSVIPASESAKPVTKKGEVNVNLTTSKGVITLKLYPDKAPLTVANFLAKAKSNYYKNLTFHRVEDWVIQGGDPEGTGRGGGDIATELSSQPFTIGSLGVARGGDIKISNDSQFFICITDCSFLTGKYTNFGEVVNGMDVARAIAIGDKILSIVETK